MGANDLPELSDLYPLTPDQVEAYRRDGHALLRSVCSPVEVSVYRDAIVDTVARLKTENRPLEKRDTYGKAFLQIMNLWEHDQRVRRYVLARRFAGIAARLMGVGGVRLFHDQALFKEGGGGHTPWHQDQYYWPLDTPHTITMWMPLVDVTPDMGPMTFVSSSHRLLEKVADQEISDESEAYFNRLVAERGLPGTQPTQVSAGDATFHSGRTLHRAAPNTTGKMREVMTIIYYADGTRVSALTEGNRGDLAWMPGCQPGDVAASPRNPVVYSDR